MATVWTRNGVKAAWVRALLSMCAAMAVCVWVFAPYAILFQLGTAALLVWELPTPAATCGLVRLRHWQVQMRAHYVAYNSQAAGAAARDAMPGPDDSADEEGVVRR